MFAKTVLLNRKLGVVLVVTSHLGLTRPSSIFFSFGIVRDIVPPVIFVLTLKTRLTGNIAFVVNARNTSKGFGTICL